MFVYLTDCSIAVILITPDSSRRKTGIGMNKLYALKIR